MEPDFIQTEDAITSKELLKKLNMGNTKLRELIKEGLPHFKIGSDYRFFYSKVVAYLEGKK